MLLCILLIPNLFVLNYFKEISGSISMSMAYLMLALVIWLLPLVFLRKKVYFGLGFVFLLLSPLEIVFVRNLGIPMTQGFVESVFRTNFTEATEQILSNWHLAILFAILIGLYIYSFKKINNAYFSRRVRIVILLFALIFNALLFVNMYRIQVSADKTVSAKLISAYKSTKSKYRKTYPTDLVLNTIQTLNSFQANKKLRKQIDHFHFNALSANDKNQEELVVLVIGESARFENFGINGYLRDTTPQLRKLENLLSFTDVYSGSVVTTYSVPMILTRATPQNLSIQHQEKTILDAFQEAGFFTAWFANQNSNYPVTRRLTSVADFSKINYFDVQVKDYYDTDIMPDFNRILNENSKKKFVAIHSLGSHFRYTNRYPKEFERFQPVMEEFGYGELNYENQPKVLNAFDNSILYTDYFLSQLISELNKTGQSAVLLYLSDHGENLFDDENKIFGHGTANPTPYEYHIPYFIWYSDEFEQRNPEKINQLKINLNKKASATSVFYTLLDLANIHYTNSESEKINSLASKNYKIPNERFILNSDLKLVKIKN